MAEPATITILPMGTPDLAELEASTKRVAKNLGLVVELAKPISMPPGHFDPARSQSDARKVVAAVPATVTAQPRPAPGTTADPKATRAATLTPMEAFGSRGTAPAPAPGKPAPSGPIRPIKVGVTDSDMYLDYRDYVFSHVEPNYRRAVVSTKRLKEAFWRRKSDPAKQQTRLVREIMGAVALAAGAPPCPDPACPASAARGPLDIDQKGDRLCHNCDLKLRGGAVRL